METLIRVLLVLLYPLLLVGRFFNLLLRRDPLRQDEPEGATCWIERGAELEGVSYFSQASAQEGRNHGGFGRFAAKILVAAARLFAPSRAITGNDFRAAAERDQDIPDEVYTLW